MLARKLQTANTCVYAGLVLCGTGYLPQVHAQGAQPALEEIIITAQRREENLQDVPISVSAWTARQIRELEIRNTVDLSALTPGMYAAGSRGDVNPLFSIRGIGLNDTFSNNNPTVGIYFDDVVQPLPPLLSLPVYDLERIEVLKGPQGTLYGRNTTGGAINFISKRPTAEFDSYFLAGYSRFERFDLEAAVGGPISDELAFRLSARSVQQSDGWQTNALTGETIGDRNNNAVRGQLLWTPSDDVEVWLKASYIDEKADNQLREHMGYNAPGGGDCIGFLNGVRDEGNCVNVLGYFDPTNDRRSVENSELYGHDNEVQSYDLTVDVSWDLGNVTLTSITGYVDYSRDLGDDSDGAALIMLDSFYRDDIESFTQELRLASDGDSSLSWVLGFYYAEDEVFSDFDQALDEHFFLTRVEIDALQETTAYSLFGQADYPLSDRLTLTAGFRYTNEDKDLTYDAFDTDPFGTSQFLPTPIAGIDNDFSEDDVSGRLSLDYALSDQTMVYASASRGFKSGGYKTAIAFNVAELDPFEGEHLNAYEVGTKTTWLDGKMQFNAAAYYYDYQDFQAFVTEIRGGINVIVLSNAGDAEVYGLEAELTARPTERLFAKVAGNVMSTEIVRINPEVQADYEGNEMANAPELTLFGLLRYQLPTEELGFGSYLMADTSYRSDIFFSVNNRGQNSQDGFWLLNARVGFQSPDERWDFALWGRNLTDELYVNSSYDNYGGIFPSQNFLGDPRTYGVTLSYTF